MGASHLDDLASINIVMLALGTVGGLGFIIAAAVTPAFRGYNRVSIVIAMVALLAVGALIDRAFRKHSSRNLAHLRVAAALVLFGLFDQVGVIFDVDVREAKAANEIQREFGASVQKTLPENAAIFQLPYVEFPGAGKPLPEGSATTTSSSRTFTRVACAGASAPCAAGRSGWQAQTASLPLPAMIRRIKEAGFLGALRRQSRLRRQGRERIAAINALLGQPDVVSSDGRMLLWRIE